MPFEPIGSDEPLSGRPMKQEDPDREAAAGCFTFVVMALLTYGLCIWPFFVFADIRFARQLWPALAFGCGTTLVAGFVFGRLSAAAACGFMGGALAFSVFLFLRLREVTALSGAPDARPAEFPPSFAWLLPLAWAVVALVPTILGLIRPLTIHEQPPAKSR